MKDITLYHCAAECALDDEGCLGIVYESLTNDCSVLEKTVADLGGKTPGLGGENMVYLRILNTIAKGIVPGFCNAYPTYIHVLCKSFIIILCHNSAGLFVLSENHLFWMRSVAIKFKKKLPQKYKYLTEFMFMGVLCFV